MASFSELVELFKNGELGKLLASTFKGERGRVYRCNEDLEFLVVFHSEKETPQVDSLREAVEKYYTEKGYFLVPKINHGQGCLEFFVFFRSRDEGVVHVVITTNYPFPTLGEGRASLRVTSSIFEP